MTLVVCVFFSLENLMIQKILNRELISNYYLKIKLLHYKNEEIQFLVT